MTQSHYRSINPYLMTEIASFPLIDDAGIEAALAASQQAFAQEWGSRPVTERAAILRRAAEALRADVETHARTITLEMGKLIGEVRDEVRLTADIFAYYADNAERLLAPVALDTTLASEATVVTRPLGPIFCAEPWNLPYYQLVRVAAPNSRRATPSSSSLRPA